ncbi:TPA: hypothetical protein I6861_000244 [Vibrio cholerae]|nr:hypothetical protein [Vibrio cholerae]
MSRKSEQDFFKAMFVLAFITFGMFSLTLAKVFEAPWDVTFKFMFQSLLIGACYCLYAYVRYILIGSNFQSDYDYYSYSKSWYHYVRIWPFALLLIFLNSFDMLDHAGSVTYSGFISKPKSHLFLDPEKAWYTFWYGKLLISSAILIIGHLIHHSVAQSLRKLFG